MKFLFPLVAAGLAAAASVPRSALSTAAAAANPSTSGTLFNIDGDTKYYAGTNSYWISFLTNNSDVDLVMSHLQSSGLKILRVWGFNDVNTIPQSGTVYYQALVPGSDPVINTGADGLQRLDAVVASATKYGIKLIINFVNNWTDYGGMAAYLNYFGNTSGSTADNNPNWYNNTNAQAQYRKYIQAVVSRYSNSSAIFAWELANEPRCRGCDTSVIYDWASSTSAYIKSLDSSHMVTIGDEGFGLPGDGSYPYQYGEGLDFVKNLGIKTLDFGTLHLYPGSWGTSNAWAVPWIQAHGSACVNASKPCLLEEYGTGSDHCAVESVWQATANSTAGIAADLFWQLGDTISTGQTSNDGNTIYYGTSDWTCLVTDHVGASS